MLVLLRLWSVLERWRNSCLCLFKNPSCISYSMLKKYHQVGAHVIQWDSVLLYQNMTFEEEPITILDRKIRKLRSKEIASVKVQWKHRPVEEATWETESDMRSKYPHLFERSG